MLFLSCRISFVMTTPSSGFLVAQKLIQQDGKYWSCCEPIYFFQSIVEAQECQAKLTSNIQITLQEQQNIRKQQILIESPQTSKDVVEATVAKWLQKHVWTVEIVPLQPGMVLNLSNKPDDESLQPCWKCGEMPKTKESLK